MRPTAPPFLQAPSIMACLRTLGALAVGGWAAAAVAATPAACPLPRAMSERFVSADCAACWQAVPPRAAATLPGPDFVLDWIAPGSRGEQAPLAVGALPEAAARAAQAGRLADDEALVLRSPLPQPSALQLTVQDGPAWNGYIGLQLRVEYRSRRPLPEGLSGWLALVEDLPAGEDGSPVARRLVRAVAGPLPLAGLARQPVEHLRAMRLPETPRPERLRAVGWVETARGRPLAVGERPRDDCAAPPAAGAPGR